MKLAIQIVTVVAFAWIVYRVISSVYRALRKKKKGLDSSPPAPKIPCPQCGSKNLDEYSDKESGYCLECGHIWGVSSDKETEDEEPPGDDNQSHKNRHEDPSNPAS
jgi:DNA-directed RNA polymerase subunit RPC12/RpoP